MKLLLSPSNPRYTLVLLDLHSGDVEYIESVPEQAQYPRSDVEMILPLRARTRVRSFLVTGARRSTKTRPDESLRSCIGSVGVPFAVASPRI